VGAHCLRAVQAAHAELDALGTDGTTPQMRDTTLVAALAHDAGKREAAPGHAARGAESAQAAAVAFGLDEEHAGLAGRLVAEHLLLSNMAAHTDPTDEDAVLAAAARLGDARLIAPLYALTVADMRATGPDVWTTWRAALIGDLAAKLEDALSPDVDGAGIVAAAEATRASAMRTAASVGASRAVLSFLEHAPLRYLARRTSVDVLRDARLVQSIAGPGAPGRFTFSVSVGPAEGTWLVDVVTRDRPGLFATLSGALALVGLDALSAEAFCDRSGIALDTFIVASATRASVGSETWNSFDRTVGAVLSGTFDLDTRLAERRRHYPSNPTAPAVTSVEVGSRGMFTTSIRVRATDRVGLLHDLARAIASHGLDIRRAAITTLGGVAADVFDVTDAEGAPPDPDALRRELVTALEEAASP
jgi:[protein-PII] uridylyltransferase